VAPQRRCIGCGVSRDKGALTRLALDSGRVVIDRRATLPGRGAYVCGPACAELAVRRRAFGRAFRRAVTVDPNLVELLGR
jgi:predicted RNA-binding protein YlxR (DUF448 family)